MFTSGAQQTLPIWIFANLQRPRELPIVNVVALFVIVASIVPVYLAQKLSRGVATGVPVGDEVVVRVGRGRSTVPSSRPSGGLR